MAATLADIPPDIIQTNILPRLDGRSLSTVATLSSDLHSLCSDHNLWSHICMCMWPSITHPQVDMIISTFPGGYRSLFQDSFPSLITDNNNNINNLKKSDCSSCYLDNSQLISAVDIRYQTDVIYSTVQFTDTTTDFLWSEFLIKLTEEHGISRLVDIEVNELHLKESMTLNWIIIDPTLKRAGNLSTIKPVSVKRNWVSNKTTVKYATVLPGCDPNEMVQCRIEVVLGVGHEGEGLRVKEVRMKLLTVDSCWLSGGDFLVISQRAILGVNNVRRKVVDDNEIYESWREFKEMKRQRREWVMNQEEKKKSVIMMDYIWVFMSLCVFTYFLCLVSRVITRWK